MREVVIASGARTEIGSFGTSWKWDLFGPSHWMHGRKADCDPPS